jgi:hypothetical protein
MATAVIGDVGCAVGIGPGSGISDGAGASMAGGTSACAWVASKIGAVF